MDTIKTRELWGRVQSLFTRQRYRGVPDDHHEDHNEILALQSQPSTSTFSLASFSSFSSTLPKPQTTAVKSQPVDERNKLLGEGDGKFHITTTEEFPASEVPISDPRGQERWIVGVKHCARVGVIVIALNVVLISIAAGLASRVSGNSGFGLMAVLYSGNCGTTKIWDICLHLVINALSTSILGASNYCMQTLVAPTREDVDRAHASGRWLDIGSASVKNLLAIGKDRLALWIVLMITTTPFHLMYNSILFESLSTNEFGTIVGPRDLNSSNVYDLATPYIEQCFGCPTNFSSFPGLSWTQFAHEIANNNYERHEFSACTGTAHTGYKAIIMLAENLTVADGGNAALLATDNTYNNLESNKAWATPFFNATESHGDVARCQNAQVVWDIYYDLQWSQEITSEGGKDIRAYANNYDVKECLVIKAEQHCELLYSPVICVVVMLTAGVKVTAMFLAAHVSESRPPPLLTVGDAITSFLTRPDPTTKNQCWMSGQHVREGLWKSKSDPYDEVVYRYLTPRRHWFWAATFFRWAITLALVFGTLSISIWLLVLSIYGMPDGIKQFLAPSQFTSLFSADVEENDYGAFYISENGASMLSYVVVANMPQLIVTLCYYCYNAVLTSMLAEAEYSSHAIKRKPLRVTWPVKGSEQRSTYYLSVPYRYGAPVLVLYTILHWMISQAIFYLWLIPYTPINTRDTATINAVGYSSSFVFFSVLTGLVMAVLPCVLAFRRFKSNIPLAGSCSAAISAACHPPPDEDLSTVALGKVRWGQVISWSQEFSNSLQPNDSDNSHCAFTSLETVNPTLTKRYA